MRNLRRRVSGEQGRAGQEAALAKIQAAAKGADVRTPAPLCSVFPGDLLQVFFFVFWCACMAYVKPVISIAGDAGWPPLQVKAKQACDRVGKALKWQLTLVYQGAFQGPGSLN